MVKMNKKAQELNFLKAAAISFVALTIILGFGGTILEEFKDQNDANSSGENVTIAGLGGINTFGDFLGIIALALVAVAILSLINRAFGG